MKNLMAPNIPLDIILFAMVAAIAFRAAARRLEPPGTGAAPVTVVAGQCQSQPRAAVTVAAQGGAGGDMGRPASAVDQAQRVFHELHADGRHALCAVCDSQYASA